MTTTTVRLPATVAELLPGDVVHLGSQSGCFVARTQHPVWPKLQLVIWRLDDGTWSHDALDARQHVGDVERGTEPLADAQRRHERVRAALTGQGAAWLLVTR